jgi:hypothetical protein
MPQPLCGKLLGVATSLDEGGLECGDLLVK